MTGLKGVTPMMEKLGAAVRRAADEFEPKRRLSPRHKISMTVSERILASVTKDAATGCWIWARSTDRDGYGNFRFQKKMWIAHRTSYQQFVGPIPKGLTLDHLCRNRRCVNPDHLEPVTHKENVRRGARGAQTHCKRGHEFNRENTFLYDGTRRGCKLCRRINGERRRARRAFGKVEP